MIFTVDGNNNTVLNRRKSQHASENYSTGRWRPDESPVIPSMHLRTTALGSGDPPADLEAHGVHFIGDEAVRIRERRGLDLVPYRCGFSA